MVRVGLYLIALAVILDSAWTQNDYSRGKTKAAGNSGFYASRFGSIYKAADFEPDDPATANLRHGQVPTGVAGSHQQNLEDEIKSEVRNLEEETVHPSDELRAGVKGGVKGGFKGGVIGGIKGGVKGGVRSGIDEIGSGVRSSIDGIKGGVRSGIDEEIRDGVKGGVRSGIEGIKGGVKGGVRSGIDEEIRDGVKGGVRSGIEGIKGGVKGGVRNGIDEEIRDGVKGGVRSGIEGIKGGVKGGVRSGIEGIKGGVKGGIKGGSSWNQRTTPSIIRISTVPTIRSEATTAYPSYPTTFVPETTFRPIRVSITPNGVPTLTPVFDSTTTTPENRVTENLVRKAGKGIKGGRKGYRDDVKNIKSMFADFTESPTIIRSYVPEIVNLPTVPKLLEEVTIAPTTENYRQETIAPTENYRQETIAPTENYRQETIAPTENYRQETIAPTTENYRQETIAPTSNDLVQQTVLPVKTVPTQPPILQRPDETQQTESPEEQVQQTEVPDEQVQQTEEPEVQQTQEPERETEATTPRYIPTYPTTQEPIYPTTQEPIYPTTQEPIYPTTQQPIYPTTEDYGQETQDPEDPQVTIGPDFPVQTTIEPIQTTLTPTTTEYIEEEQVQVTQEPIYPTTQAPIKDDFDRYPLGPGGQHQIFGQQGGKGKGKGDKSLKLPPKGKKLPTPRVVINPRGGSGIRRGDMDPGTPLLPSLRRS